MTDSCLKAEALALIKEIMPAWTDIDESLVSLKRFVSSSNAVYCITAEADVSPNKLIYRVFGARGVIDTPQERAICSKLSQIGVIPQVCFFDEQRSVEEFLDGFVALSRLDLADPVKAELIAKQLRILHSQDLSNLVDTSVSNTVHYVNRWRSLARSTFSHEEFFSQEALDLYIDLQTHLGDQVFCHNDMTTLNILYNSYSKTLKLIDFEYSGYAPRSTDLAFTLTEILFEYEVDEHPYFVYNGENSPVTDELVALYVTKYGGDAALWVQVQLSRVACHYFWSMWAAAKALDYDPTGFDYLEFARLRFRLFKEWHAALDVEALKARAAELLGSPAD
jgi:thiamine kinase-like enzyme